MEATDKNSLRQLWQIRPAPNGYSQLLHVYEGDEWALDLDSTGALVPVLFPRAGDDRGQRWRIESASSQPANGLVGTWDEYRTANGQPSGSQTTIGADGSFVTLRNGAELDRGRVEIVGNRLTLIPLDGPVEVYTYSMKGNRVDFLRAGGRPEVFYWQAVTVPVPVVPDLRPRLITRKVVRNPPLAPVEVELANSYDRELWITVQDLGDPKESQRLKIPAGEATRVTLDRDAGATVFETWEVPLRTGEVVLDERETPIPPKPLYRVSVYELFAQSIAIDGTKRGKGRIEDVNYSPKSVGAFPSPAGSSLKDGSSIDVYERAERQKNPGAVDRIDPREWSGRPSRENDPVEQLLRPRRP
jgi:hypothetical protein